CLRLFVHCVLAAASRTFCTAGRRRPIRMAMIAITTSSSINVKADRPRGLGLLNRTTMVYSLSSDERKVEKREGDGSREVGTQQGDSRPVDGKRRGKSPS